MSQIPVITIDGPSGVGKGTISLLLAERLRWHLLDSGALYRVLSLAAQRHEINLESEAELEALAIDLDVSFEPSVSSEKIKIILEGDDVTDTIRTENQGTAASKVSKFQRVRQTLLKRQQTFRQAPGLVAEGRDMGTVVFPDASLKIYMTASPEERAGRRFKQLQDKGIDVKLADLVTEIAERDKRDRERAVAPLKPADDAVIIDTTSLSIDEAMLRVMSEVERCIAKL